MTPTGNFNLIHVVEQLVKSPGIPWSIGPKSLVGALVTMNEAQAAHVDATDLVNDTQMDLPIVQGQWEADARIAVKAGDPLPSRDPIDTARIKADLAVEDERTARTAAQRSLGVVAGQLDDPAVRSEWLDAINARLDDIGVELTAHAASVAG